MAAGTATDVILSDVRYAASEFTDQSGIKVSLQAQDLIASVFGAFLFDPHPLWHADRTDHTEFFNAHLAKLPQYLAEIAGQPNVHGEITSFDVLGWLSRNLHAICDYACPF